MSHNRKINIKTPFKFTHLPINTHKTYFKEGLKLFHKMEQHLHITMILQLHKHVKLIQHKQLSFFIAAIIHNRI